MTLRLALFLAFKSTFSRIGVFLLVVSIISVSIANSFFVTGIFEGMNQAMASGVIKSTYSNIIIDPYDDEEFITSADAVVRKIESIPGVERVARRIDISGTIIHQDRTVSPLFIFGIDPEREMDISDLPERIQDGSYLRPLDRGKIMLGADIANSHYQSLIPEEDTLGVDSGENVSVVFSKGGRQDFDVAGVFYSKALLADHSAFIHIEDAERILGVEDAATQIVVKVPRGQEQEFIGQIRELGIPGNIYHWRDKGGFVNFITATHDVINAIVTTFSIIAVATAIFVVLYIQITNRKRHIGIMKAIGIDDRVVLYAHIFQAIIYGTFGIALGLFFYQLIVFYFTARPLATALGDAVPYLEASTLATNSLMMLAVSVIGGFAPAYYASRENIIRAIWG